jgi:chitodextrinase
MSVRIAVVAVLLLLGSAAPAAAQRDRTPPTTPQNLRVTATTPTTVSLAWNASTDNAGSVTYTVREDSTRTFTTSATTLTRTGLVAGRTYRYVVQAVDRAGNRSGNSNTVTVTTPPAAAPTAPRNLRVTGTTPTTVSLAWDPSTHSTSFEYVVRESSGATWWTGGAATQRTITGLAPDRAYTFVVYAIDLAWRRSADSNAVPATTPPDLAPPTPPVLSVDQVGVSEVALTWTPSTDDSLVTYDLRIDGAPPRRNVLPGPSARRITAMLLRARTTYEFELVARDTSGNASVSEPLVVTTAAGDASAPTPVPNLRVAGTTPSSVVLAWGWAPDHTDVLAYEILVDGELVHEQYSSIWYFGTPDGWYAVRHLAPGSTHTFAVRARDHSGNVSAPSEAVTVTLPPSADTVPPTAPTLLSGFDTGCAWLDLQWGRSTDGVDATLEYEIWEDGAFLGLWRDEVFEVDFGRHSYVVKAVDRSGNTSASSNELVLDMGFC